MLDRPTIDTIKATVPVLQEHGLSITKCFYQNLFTNHPELRNIFNQSNQQKGDQQHALANAIYTAAVNIERLETILPALRPVLHKHRSLHIQAHHYPIVGQHLLGAIKQVLGDAATPAIIDAWDKAYGLIADTLISLEKELYAQAPWVGFKAFTITQSVADTDHVKQIKLSPTDGIMGGAYEPGQYLSVQIQIQGQDILHNRQYSIIAQDTDGYWIAPKAEGIVSKWLHQLPVNAVVQVSSPAGDFVLSNTQQPILLVAGGIGITPMYSMAVAALKAGRSVTLVQAARNAAERPLSQRIAHLVEQGLNLVVHHDDENGYLNPQSLVSLKTADTEIYACGPVAMLKSVVHILPETKYEIFGPSLALAAA